MVEAEMFSYNIKELIKLIEDLVKFSFKSVIKKCKTELSYLENYSSKTIVKDLENICQKKIPVVTYKKCLELLIIKNKKEIFICHKR